VPRAGGGLGLAGGGDGGVAVVAHLTLVLADGRDEVVAGTSGPGPIGPRSSGSGQRAAEQRRVLQRRVRPRTTRRAHRVDGVAEHGDPARRPRRHRRRGPDPDQERLVHGGPGVQRAQVRVPGPDQPGGQRVQLGRRHGGQPLVRDPEPPAVRRHRPHQVVPGRREPRRGPLGPLPEPDQAGRHADRPAGHRGESVPQRGRQHVLFGGAERGLAVDAPLAGIGRRGGGQVLAAHRRADAVRADQQVRLGPAPAGETQPDAVLACLVAGQLAAEHEPAVQAGGQHLAQRLAVDRGGQRGRGVRVGGPGPSLLVQHAQPLAHHRQPRARVAAGGLEQREGSGRQALLEGQPGPGVDVQPVALPPGGQLRVPLVDRDVDAGLEQALGQAEATEAAARHGHPQPAHRPGPAGGSASPAAGRPASARVIACRIHQVAYVLNR